MISVPIVSVPPSYRCDAEVEHRAHREHAEELDRREEDREDLLRRTSPELRFASFSASNSAWKRRSRLNACTIAMPATDSAICAVTAPIRLRSSTFAACDTRWNQRERMSAGGRTTKATSPSRQSAMRSASHRRGQEDDVRDEGRHALREDVRDRVDVARQARDDPARLLLREVAEREAGQVVEEVAPQADHDRPGRSSRGRG